MRLVFLAKTDTTMSHSSGPPQVLLFSIFFPVSPSKYTQKVSPIIRQEKVRLMVKSFNTQPSICNSDYPEALCSENQFASFYSICCWCAPWWEAILLCSLPGYNTNNMLIFLMQQEEPVECIWTEQQEDISKQVLIYQSPDMPHYREKRPSLLNNVKSSVLGGRVGRFQRQFAIFHFRKLIKEQLRLWLGRP